ncbi:DUF2336 domain-containing protein [Telmatospirillum siberiense]|uniref:DUF2336 domain-containing protein n=1 Tax=Telmatospirillum siberiense TaxID=382514 RepID=A0A2N3Q0M0_9PROT|nr:DUF2336 domain-containing protein [Telmatospirillum siberiense]PKU26209.1 hypothetical protein CWS72_03555 [Telmatospirillum siberiense]
MSRFIGKVLGVLRGKGAVEPDRQDGEAPPLTYEQSRDLALHADPEVRRRLAGRQDLRPEILYFLADDPAPQVRRQIAANLATPAQADFHLAADTDPSVRGDLAQKIARLAPGLSADEQDRLRHITYETLQLLARDQITRVRQILAEALKDVADAPPAVIRQLAHDSELAVASPVLEYSPVLTDEDLLEIIRDCPISGALSAICRRKGLGGAVADGIARTDDIDAIAVLLANSSAQVREETLDLLIDRAPDYESWHLPLVRRPHLSGRAATRLARFVADNLLQVLERRSDFDPNTKAAVAAVVRRRVEEAGADMAEFRRGRVDEKGAVTAETAMEHVTRLLAENSLSDAVILDALSAGDREFVICALALRAEVSVERVRKIIETQSAKGMVAVCWKAGMAMTATVPLQTKLAKVIPSDVLRPRSSTADGYPMSPDEMLWQLEFFASMVGDGTTVP